MTLKEYIYANSVDQTLKLLSDPQVSSQLIAGGAVISAEIRSGLFNAERLIDISRVPALSTVEMTSANDEEYLSLGAGLTIQRAAHHDLIRRHFPLLQKVLLESCDPARRNAYTFGGILAKRVPRGMIIPALCAMGALVVIKHLGREEIIPLVTWMSERPEDDNFVISELLFPTGFRLDWEVQTVMRRNYPGEIVVGVLAARDLNTSNTAQVIRLFASVDSFGLLDLTDFCENLKEHSITEDYLSILESRIDSQLKNSWPDDNDANYRIKLVTTLVKRSLLQLMSREGSLK